jgi:hypothetical protein
MKASTTRRMSSFHGSIAFALLAISAACSDPETGSGNSMGGGAGTAAMGGLGSGGTSSTGEPGGANGAGEAGQDATAGSDGGPDPVFLLGTRVWDDAAATSYFHIVDSLEPGTKVDDSKAIEVPGAAKLYAIADLGWFAIGDGETPTLTRYTLAENGTLVRGAELSLVNYGVASLWDTLYVVSATKLYYPDRENARLIIINPTEMRIVGEVELPETVRKGYVALYGYKPHFRNGELLFSVGWFDWDNDRVLPETGLVVLDTTTDSARFEVDDRCGGITTSVEIASGDVYFVSSALAGATHRIGRLGTEPCALRLRAGAGEFDPDYLSRLEDVTGAQISGEPIPAGGNALFLRALDESLARIAPETASWDITGQSAWRWWRWDVVTGAAEELSELGPSTADVLWFQVGRRVFGTETKTDYSETTLIELTAEEGPRRALTAPGFLHGVAQIR